MASILPAANSQTGLRRSKRRQLKDRLAHHLIGIGGVSVIIAIVLIFFYLLYVVFPLFIPGEMEAAERYPLPNKSGNTLHLALEEYNEIAVRFTDNPDVHFFNTRDGSERGRFPLKMARGEQVSSFATGAPVSRLFGYGYSNGTVMVAKHQYQIEYHDNTRDINPKLEFPLGEEPIVIDENGEAITQFALQDGEERALIVACTADQRVLITSIGKASSFMDDEMELETETTTLEAAPETITHILLDQEQRNLYIADASGQISSYDVSDPSEPELTQRLSVVASGQRITALRFLTGDISLLIGTSNGTVSQWFPVTDKNNVSVLTKIREFKVSDEPITSIASEYFRKGFITADQEGEVAIHHSTAERTILREQIAEVGLHRMAIAPHANALIAEDNHGEIHFWTIENEHPEVSWSSLWGKVWYESYDKPDYIWQSSSASNDFEPKFSLIPISFGTIKAAFYAMLFAVPIAIMGAIYTAYFMTPKMRSTVKPSIEIMEALPTVILGFLAGLWLAPYLEAHLPGVFTLMLLLPLSILLCSYLWFRLPRELRGRVPDGWQAAVLILPIIITAWAALTLSQPMEALLFEGDMRGWMDAELGIGFDQRNSMVVGLAMGFAIIPTIFSITEDAIFSVPRHLTTGSLALGATQWQTLVRVVLLTASPGIFSAVMIGLGRAVGETMIVLMATGNTPVMDFSIFQGMRTLSANIAVEMPESEVASTHYRILFLAALVLFMFTFLFNTVAEIVRQQLRKKYSSL